MTNQTVKLPDIPKGKDLEDFVSAAFQVSGAFVERNIVERDVEEILELDVLSTTYSCSAPSVLLTEVKSGNYGFPDIFKLRGWMDYLKIDKAIFVTTQEHDHGELFRERAARLNISHVVIPDLANAGPALADFTQKSKLDSLDVAIWRFSYLLERKMMNELVRRKKADRTAKRYPAICDYAHTVNSGAFFEATAAERMQLLSEAYKEYPHLSAKVANEMSGGTFEDDVKIIENGTFRETFSNCKITDVQLSTMIEYKARLGLLKHAIDYIVYTNDNKQELAQDKTVLKVFGWEHVLSSFDCLPQSFRDGIEVIRKDAYCHRYPVFWQWFMWVYGGFLLLDRQDEEMQHMAERTGIPVSEIPKALKAFDVLFPTAKGWLRDMASDSKIRKLSMFPVPFAGLGAHYRRRIYTDGNDFNKQVRRTGEQ